MISDQESILKDVDQAFFELNEVRDVSLYPLLNKD